MQEESKRQGESHEAMQYIKMKMQHTLKVTWHIINDKNMLWDTLSNANVILYFAVGITVFVYTMLKFNFAQPGSSLSLLTVAGA